MRPLRRSPLPSPRGPRGRGGTLGDGRPLARGAFCLSLDFELVWGSRDLVEDVAALERAALITREQVFEPLLHMLLDLDIQATWATVGHLFLEGGQPDRRGVLHGDMVPPAHAWQTRPWYADVPTGTEEEAPAWYARSLVRRLAAAGQDVGSHGFSHVILGDPGCSRACAESELARCVAEAHALGIDLKSFVFPRNIPGHVDLLARHGFRSWRPPEPAWYNRWPVGRSTARLGHLAEVFTRRPPPAVLPWRDEHDLWCIPASGTFLPVDGVRTVIPMASRVDRALAGIELALEQRALSHLYFHPINAAADPERVLSGLREILERAALLRDHGILDIFSMDQLVTELEGET